MDTVLNCTFSEKNDELADAWAVHGYRAWLGATLAYKTTSPGPIRITV